MVSDWQCPAIAAGSCLAVQNIRFEPVVTKYTLLTCSFRLCALQRATSMPVSKRIQKRKGAEAEAKFQIQVDHNKEEDIPSDKKGGAKVVVENLFVDRAPKDGKPGEGQTARGPNFKVFRSSARPPANKLTVVRETELTQVQLTQRRHEQR